MPSARPGTYLTLPLLAVLAVAIPAGTAALLPRLPALGRPTPLYSGGSTFPPSSLPLMQQALDALPEFPPWITNVQIVDVDDDGLNDVAACDARRHRVVWHRQRPEGGWEERVLGEDLLSPAHATIVDLDQDGRRDVVVSVLGDIWPDDRVIGRLVLLHAGADGFEQRILLDDVHRVADAQAGDLDGDGDLDLAVAVFGYAHGAVLWLENLGNLEFRDHVLRVAPGIIHVPLADYDGDGDLDIAAVVTQDDEEIWAFENQGGGKFQSRRLMASMNFDLGGAGLVSADLDGDGDVDLVLPVGDNLEEQHAYPQPYHGCFWLENEGGWKFTPRRIARFGGTYAAAVGDLNADGHADVVLVSMFNAWENPAHASLIWLENDGRQNFRAWQIAAAPTHLVTVACGDLNGDGRDDIVAGGLHLLGPFDRLGSVTGWLSVPGRAP
jgi:hypothetical protein